METLFSHFKNHFICDLMSKQVYVSIIENNKKIHRASIVGDNEIVNYMYIQMGHNESVALLRTSLNNPRNNISNW